MISEKKPYPFPSETAHPKVKEGKEWGMQAAKAIYNNNNYDGQNAFFNKRAQYEYWTKFAFGENDPSEFKPSLGINPNDSKQTWLKAIRWEIKNYATKRVNVAVSRVHGKKYEAILEAIDKHSLSKKEEYYARVQTVMENKHWIEKQQMRTGMNFMPQGMSEDSMPQTPEELNIHREMHYKDAIASEVEKGVKNHLIKNSYEELRRQLITDCFLFGVKVPWVGMDENTRPIIKRLHPGKCIFPYSDVPNFDNLKYGAYVDEYDIGTFKRMHNGELSHVEQEIIDEHAKKNNFNYYYDNSSQQYVRNDDVYRIKIMHFEVKTVNEKVYVKFTDKAGNSRFVEEDFNYYKGGNQQSKFNQKFDGKKELIRKPYECVYEGYWIVGSKFIFRYGKKHNQERVKGKYGHLGQTQIGYKPYAPNMYEGRQVSTLNQMIPTLKDLQTYHLKIQHLISSAIPQGIGIDLWALSNAKLKWNNKEMSDQQKIEMFMQSGIFTFNSGNKHKPGSNYKPFYVEANGISQDLERYLQLLQQKLMELDEIIGVNRVTAASSVHQDTGKGVAEYQIQATETALDYLYNADQHCFNEITKSLAILHVQMLKYHEKSDFTDSYGDQAYNLLTDPKFDITKVDFAYYVEAEPTKEEWNQLYQKVEDAYQKQIISLSDAIAVRQIDNLKQARAYLVVMEKRNARERAQQQQREIEANAKVQQQSNQQTHNNKLEQIDKENQWKERIQSLENEYKQLELDIEERKTRRLEMLKGRQDIREIEEQTDQDIRFEKATAGLDDGKSDKK